MKLLADFFRSGQALLSIIAPICEIMCLIRMVGKMKILKKIKFFAHLFAGSLPTGKAAGGQTCAASRCTRGARH
jgi:hypothetical protein